MRKTLTRTLATTGLVAIATLGGAAAANANTWDDLAQCESSGNWSIDTGNGYYGGLQFSQSTWEAYGGTGNPAHASKAEQIRIAEKVQAGQGWGAWPACSSKLGLSGDPVGEAAPAPEPAPAPAPKAEAPQAPAQEQAPAPQTAPAAPAPAAATPSGETYTVAAGDTLFEIATAHGATVDELWSVNYDTIADVNLIYAGEVLNLPA